MLLDSLKILVNQAETEGWNESELYSVLEDFVQDYYCDDDLGCCDDDYNEYNHIELLKGRIKPWNPPSDLPPLPEATDISLHGVGIIYDEDKDNRVLLAIQQLLLFEGKRLGLFREGVSDALDTQQILEELTRDIEGFCDKTTRIVAVFEYKAKIHVYCREVFDHKAKMHDVYVFCSEKSDLGIIELCNDEWEIVYYYPADGVWVAQLN